MKSKLILGASLCLAVAADSLAGVLPIRRDSALTLVVWSSTTNTTYYPLRAASNFDPFVASLGPETTQSSLISRMGATYSGSTVAYSNGDPIRGTLTQSLFRYTFKVTTRVSFRIDGSLRAAPSGYAQLGMSTVGAPSAPNFSATAAAAPRMDTAIHWTGEFGPGTDLLAMEEGFPTRVDAPPDSNTASQFELSFKELGCPSDINADGFVDDADFIPFIVAYDALLCP